MRHILIMLEFYFFMLFCVPLPVVCAGNAAGLAATALLFAATVRFSDVRRLILAAWKLGLAAKILLILFAAVILSACIYLMLLSMKMLRAAHKSPDRNSPCTVIALGCRVKGTRPTRMLRKRLEAAYRYLEKNPQAVCIVSGGQGADEIISEAQAMKTYLLGLGLEESRIYCEDKSVSTFENLKFSQRIIEEKGLPKQIAAATDSFHQYRAQLIAASLGMDIAAISSPTEPRYAPTYWVREWFGISLLIFRLRQKNKSKK